MKGSPTAILSDTHGQDDLLKKALKIMSKKGISTCIHCGDITSREHVKLFSRFDFHLVTGNCDVNLDLEAFCRELPFVKNVGIDLEVVLDGKKIYASHGHKGDLIVEAVESGVYDYVLHGHTHVRCDEIRGKTRILNPGAFTRVKEPTFVLLDTASDSLEVISL